MFYILYVQKLSISYALLPFPQVEEMHASALFLVLVVPLVLAILNLMWFGKIVMGLKKTLAKRD